MKITYKKIFLFLIVLTLAIPFTNAFTFEKNYYVIFDNVQLKNLSGYQKFDFNEIENKSFNNHLCDKYYLGSYKGPLEVKVPIQFFYDNSTDYMTNIVIYPGALHKYLYRCDNNINIFDFQFKSDEIETDEFSSRFAAYKPEDVFFGNIQLTDLINIALEKYVDNVTYISSDRNRMLFEFLKINKPDFTYSESFCNEVGYYMINEFPPAYFSQAHKESLCKNSAYSLLNNHFLNINSMQGFFISDNKNALNLDFDEALEWILVRKLAERTIYIKYYNIYQTKNPFSSLWLSLIKYNDKSKLYDLQDKNVNLQVTELIDLLYYVDENLQVSKYSELAITRIDRKNEMLNWLGIILTIFGTLTIIQRRSIFNKIIEAKELIIKKVKHRFNK